MKWEWQGEEIFKKGVVKFPSVLIHCFVRDDKGLKTGTAIRIFFLPALFSYSIRRPTTMGDYHFLPLSFFIVCIVQKPFQSFTYWSPCRLFKILLLYSIIISLIIYSLEFFTPVLADGFSLEFEWQQVSSSLRTLLSILAVINNAVVWMVSTHPPTSKSSSSFNNALVTVPKAPIIIGIIVTFMFHSFFQFPR